MTSIHFLLVSTLLSDADREPAPNTHTSASGQRCRLYLKLNLTMTAKGSPVSSSVSQGPSHLDLPCSPHHTPGLASLSLSLRSLG